MYVINPSTLAPPSHLFSLPYGYGNLAWNGGTGMYWANFIDGMVAVTNTDTQLLGGAVAVPFGSSYLAWDGDKGMYVTSTQVLGVGDKTIVNVVDIDTIALGATVDIGSRPYALAWDGHTGMYVTNFLDNQVTIIDTQTVSVLKSVAVGNLPVAIALGKANSNAFPEITKEPLLIVVKTTAADANIQVTTNSGQDVLQGIPVFLFAGKPIPDIGLNSSLALLLGECGFVDIDFPNRSLEQSGGANAQLTVHQELDLTAVNVNVQCTD